MTPDVRSRDRLVVANMSGFYGDRLSAAKEMVEGGTVEGYTVDVLTGDYLAELTLAILARDRAKDPQLGYAKTFLIQLREIAASCLERDIKIVVNAGGLHPAACADACRAIYRELGLAARVAHIEGDDLLPRLDDLRASGERLVHMNRDAALDPEGLPGPIVSANAYLGGWGIAQALREGADLVICPRVADASLVVGAAAWRFDWSPDDWDRIAGATVAGHVLECGAHATGGNYAFFEELPGFGQPALETPGFPIAEIDREGQATITKHPGSGGAVTRGTVTAQLIYEIESPRYVTPDVVAHFDTIRLDDEGTDRVRISGVRGTPPPSTAKVAINHHGGYKNQVTFLLTGPAIEAKADLVERSIWRRLGQGAVADSAIRLHRVQDPTGDATLYETSFSFLTLAVKDADADRVGRRFSAAAVELALSSYPGLNLTAPPGRAQPFAMFWPTIVDRSHIEESVVLDGHRIAIPHPPTAESAVVVGDIDDESWQDPVDAWRDQPHETTVLGRICGARSGDKGGNANLGLWARSDAAYGWLVATLTVERLRDLIPEARNIKIDRYTLPNLRALNFVLRGFLGDGVGGSLSIDPQAKGLGEFVRGRTLDIPTCLLAEEPSS